jgi:glucose/arabinose dehydrogenase
MRNETRTVRGALCALALWVGVAGCDGDDNGGVRVDAGDVQAPGDAGPTDVSGGFDVAAPDAGGDVADAALPDVALSDAALPDVALPDVALPDAALPDVALPDVALPDAALPDVAVGDAGADAAAPDADDAATFPDVGSGLRAKFALETVAEGMTSPVALVAPPDESGRLFVVDQVGQIRILQSSGEAKSDPFLDVSDRLVELMPDYDERGLLGLAFHPNFATSGRFYVHYSAPPGRTTPDGWDHRTVIAEFRVSDEDGDVADPQSERIILEVDQPQANHNGGTVTFGSDGMLYVSLGDGGNAYDVGPGHPPLGNGQDPTTLLGSILRLDVDRGDPYAIPEDNPFVADPLLRDEIWAYGFRNPFQLTAVPLTAYLLVADAGQELWEEVSLVEAGGNYGWNIREGTHCLGTPEQPEPPAECAAVGPRGEPLVDPVIEFANAKQEGGVGVVVVGGTVYRGSDLPDLQGRYVFAAFAQKQTVPSGVLLVADPLRVDSRGQWSFGPLPIDDALDGVIDHYVQGFGEDRDGNLYVLAKDVLGPTGQTGRVLRIVSSAPAEPGSTR